MLVFAHSTKSYSYDFSLTPIFSEFEIVTQNFKLMIFAIFYLFALSAILDEINARNYAILCKIENKTGFSPVKISVRSLVFREIEIRKIFRMDRTQKILVSRRNLLRSTYVECDYKLFYFYKFFCETNIF